MKIKLTIFEYKQKLNCFLLLLSVFFFSISYGQNATITVDLLGITNSLQEAQFSEVLSEDKSIVVQLPYDGQGERDFYVVQNNVIGENLQLEYPNIKSYSVQMVDDSGVVGAVTISPYGFFANYLVGGNLIGIRPVDFTNPYIHEVEIGSNTPFPACGVTSEDQENNLPKIGGSNSSNFEMDIYKSGTTSYTNAAGEVLKRKYDMVVAATGEFTTANGGTMASAMTVITQTVNCVNTIFNKDMAICLVLVETCIFTDPANDVFVPVLGDDEPSRSRQAADQIANCATMPYDIGHVFHNTDSAINGGITGWSGGGVAGLGVVCQDGGCNFISGVTTGACKGAGWSGSSNNTTNGWCQLATHEFGHMFGAEHTFNGNGSGGCDNNIAETNAYEIASGTTIMSYNGICGAGQNIPNNGAGDNYFHAASISQMTIYANNVSCQTDCPTGNYPPEVDADPCGAGTIDIPIGTPFKLLGSATDADGDALTYTWEQLDEDGDTTLTQGATLTQVSTINGLTAGVDPLAPLFQSYPPSPDPCRYFPNFADYLNDVNTIGTEFEVLPQVPRTLTFALTVRDCNANGGGTACELQTLNVINGGPLEIDSPCAGGDLIAGNNVDITWNTNGSDAACSNVEVLMSIDGGLTFPYNLGSSTYASGSAGITIPAGAPNSSGVRFQVICADNPCATFFAMTAEDCTIISNCLAVQTEISTDDAICLPIGDPGLNIDLTNNFGSIVTNFSGSIEDTDPNAQLIFDDCATPQCAVSGNVTNYDTYDFTPDVTGSYTFTFTGPFGLVLNLYETPYSAGTCGNHIASSGIRDVGTCPGSGSIPLGDMVTATLTAGVTYALVVSSFNGSNPDTLPAAYTVDFTTPAGANIYDGLINPIGFSYTYVAVDQLTGNIVAINFISDFTALPAGCYDIYGLHYGPDITDDIEPNVYIGQTIGGVLTSGDCVSFSTNFKEVCVKGNCAISNVVLQGTPTCVGSDAQYTICFDVNDGSSNYNLIDVDNGNAVISTIAGVAVTGVNICFNNVTVLNNSMASTINVNVVDQATATCIGANPVTINLPACTLEGCTDPNACNYDPIFTMDDGSCDYGNLSCPDPCNVILGCTDATACNYDANANCPDGSCNYGNTNCPDPCNVILGCLDATACNYDVAATCQELTSCDYGELSCPEPCNPVFGCIDPDACNYDANANCPDGSCNYGNTNCLDPCNAILGCTDATACNYNSAANCDDGSCVFPNGCTDPNACNFDPTATCDDGSCLFGADCFTFTITDPCSCNNDQSANGSGDGTFSEIIIINGPPDFELCAGINSTGILSLEDNSDISTTMPAFVEGPAGVYTLEFNHLDAVGYVLELFDCVGNVVIDALGVNSNTCYYPVIEFNTSVTLCASDDPIEFSAELLNDMPDGSSSFNGEFVYTISGASGFQFDPSIGAGTYDVNVTYIPGNGVGTTIDPDGAVCETSIDLVINVFESPDASFTCPNSAIPTNPPTVPLCGGLIDLLPVTAGGTWSGSAATFVANDQLDPSGMNVNINYILTYTTIDANACEDTFECTFQVVNNCNANGGRF